MSRCIKVCVDKEGNQVTEPHIETCHFYLVVSVFC